MVIKFDVGDLDIGEKYLVYNTLILDKRYKHNKEKSTTLAPSETDMIRIDTESKELTTNTFYAYILSHPMLKKPEKLIKIKVED